MNIGLCKCGKQLNIDITKYSKDDFEGNIYCPNCHRLYYMEIKNNLIRLGRCLRILK